MGILDMSERNMDIAPHQQKQSISKSSLTLINPINLLKYLLMCSILNRHRPTNRKVKWNGFNFVSRCCYCGKDIKRRIYGGWVLTDSDPTTP